MIQQIFSDEPHACAGHQRGHQVERSAIQPQAEVLGQEIGRARNYRRRIVEAKLACAP